MSRHVSLDPRCVDIVEDGAWCAVSGLRDEERFRFRFPKLREKDQSDYDINIGGLIESIEAEIP